MNDILPDAHQKKQAIKPMYFPMYASDMLGDHKVILMDLEQFGAYVRLLLIAWQQDPPATLPSDDKILARLLQIDEQRWMAIRPQVMNCFTKTEEGRWVQKRLRFEYEKLQASLLKRSAAGSKGVAAKRSRISKDLDLPLETDKQCSNNAEAMTKQCTSNDQAVVKQCSSDAQAIVKHPDPDPDPLNTPLPPSKEGGDSFGRFWEEYPRARKRDVALAEWAELAPGDGLIAQIMAAIAEQKTWPNQGWPMPHMWLRRKRWEDRPPSGAPTKPSHATYDMAAIAVERKEDARVKQENAAAMKQHGGSFFLRQKEAKAS